MTELLRAEVIKLRTTRTFIALAGVAIGLGLLVTALTAILGESSKEEDVLAAVFANDFSSFFILVLAVVGISGEWRHRTITSSLLAAPDRLRFLAAKTVAFSVVGVILSLLVSLSVAALGFAILGVRDLPTPDAADLIELIARNAVIAALLGALGVAVGAIVRNQVIAVVGILALSFMLEPVLLTVVPEVGRYGPFAALPATATGLDPEAMGLEEAGLLHPTTALLALVAWIGAAFAAGAALLRRRDVES
jgi:ABC-2 type transport system permease protein